MLPFPTLPRRRSYRHLAVLAAVLTVVAVAAVGLVPEGAVGQALAAAGQWVRASQAEYQLALKGAVEALRGEHAGQAALSLIGLGFIYGVLHALGPGHGKAVIGAYALANGRQTRRAVVLSFTAALVQALSAIALVAAAFLLIEGGARWATRTADRYLEPASYAAVALVGLWLVARAGLALVRAWRSARPAAAAAHHHHHDHDHHHHHHHHGDDCGCGHAHLPTPAQAEAAEGWGRILALSLAIGLRPCTGAILVLVLAFGIGLWPAGVAAALAMSLGTALTVSLLAVLASAAGRSAEAATGTAVAAAGGTARRLPLAALFGLAGGLAVTAIGVALLIAALDRPAHPLLG
ncbi:high frequency lysogenization protein HflD [Caenispirillum bisanense]|uniref:nickel/cobalt transporter n=1 Tax=Caenispirillum bisanense TaxID=414052 RepID=UPI0031DF8BFB